MSALEHMRKEFDAASEANNAASSRLERLRKIAADLDAEIALAARDEREARARLSRIKAMVDVATEGGAA